jgi:hypothetical protein
VGQHFSPSFPRADPGISTAKDLGVLTAQVPSTEAVKQDGRFFFFMPESSDAPDSD